MMSEPQIQWKGLCAINAALEEWEKRALPNQEVVHPLVSRLRAVRNVCKGAIACAENQPQAAHASILDAVNQTDVWRSLEKSNVKVPILLRDEPEELGDMCDGIQWLSRDLAEWELENVTRRAEALLDHNIKYETIDKNHLNRFRAMRACCEAIKACFDDVVEIAQSKMMTAAYEIESWLTISNQG